MKHNTSLIKQIAILVFSSILFFSSCNNNTEEIEIPEYIIPKQEMVNILVDLYIAEARYSIDKSNNVPDSIILQYNKNIFVKHNIDSVKFDSSFTFYLKHKELINDISDNVSMILNLKKNELENADKK